MKTGTVYLVGAGPGDPGLITQRGAELLKKADCLIYDRLVDPRIVRHASKRCELIDVGKGSDQGGKTQPKIDRLLVKKARQHSIVVRLKGGDPTVFGRITEELNALVRAAIPFEIVPGVSSAWAAAASVGIPLTDRHLSSSVAIVTGQEASGKKPSLRWKELARGADTLVILMGRSRLPEIAKHLVRAGRSQSTPVALIRWATTPRQEFLVSTLGQLKEDLQRHPQFGPPVVAVIGEVVRLHAKFQSKPLSGKRILVTRPVTDQLDFNRRLENLGGTCVNLPTIQIRPRTISQGQAKRLLNKLPQYNWIIFTSHHGVDALHRLAARFKRPLRGLVKGAVCAIGPRTGESACRVGLTIDLLPKEFSKEGVARAFGRISVKGSAILIPRSNLGVRDALARSLRKKGARVDEVVMYEAISSRISPRRVKKALKNLDAATFTSASTVESFVRSLKGAGLDVTSAFNGAQIVAIGPATGAALKKAGISRFYLPREGWTLEGLTQAVVEALKR